MQPLKKLYLSLIITFLIIIAIAFLIINNNSTPTAQVIQESQYSFTKAICEEKVCIDYTITCQGNKTINIKPVSEPVELPENWQDPRTQEDIDKLCD